MEHGTNVEPANSVNGHVDDKTPENDGVDLEISIVGQDGDGVVGMLSESPRTMSELNGKLSGSNGNLSADDEVDDPSEHGNEARGNHASEAGSHSEDDEPDEEEEYDEDDEDYEPALKYELLGGATETLLEKDSASALAVSPKHLVNYTSECIQFSTHYHRRQWAHTMVSCTYWITRESESNPIDLTQPLLLICVSILLANSWVAQVLLSAALKS